MMGCRRNLSPDGANQTAKAGLLAENPPNRAAPVCWTQRRVPPPCVRDSCGVRCLTCAHPPVMSVRTAVNARP